MIGENIFDGNKLHPDCLPVKQMQQSLQQVLNQLRLKLNEEIQLYEVLRLKQKEVQCPVKLEAIDEETPREQIQENCTPKIEQNKQNQIKKCRENVRKTQSQNETKNVPKNFGKAIIKFSQLHQSLVRRCLQEKEYKYDDFLANLKIRKKSLNSIAQLRSLWLDEEFEYASAMRKISFIFLNKHSLHHIFDSRIINHRAHIRYRSRMIEALDNPRDFTFLKNC